MGSTTRQALEGKEFEKAINKNILNDTKNLGNTFLVSAKRVVPGVIDQIELGNSLFMAGHLEQAIEAYQNVKPHELSAFDGNWSHYMTACCYRRIGRFDEAEAIYREVANDRNRVLFASQASDWLEFVRRRKKNIVLADEYSRKADDLLAQGRELYDEFKTR